METRQRNRTDENTGLVGKTMGGMARQRTTLGQINKGSTSSQDATKPTVRTTRAQILRQKQNDRKVGKTAGPKPVKAVAPAKIEAETPQPEPMEISVVNTELTEKIAAVEAKDAEDDCHVGPYVNECYDYLRYKEHEMAIPPRYLDGQNDITPKMRSILVDWLVQVHKRFRLQSETLYLTVSIMDRYLYTSKKISKNDMQLIGVTSMMIACKYEEIYSPEIDDFVYICDNAYKQEQILKKELEIFEMLDYNLGFPMSIQFLRRYSKTGYEVVDGTQHALAKYCLELSLMDYDLCTLKPSVLAAAALKLSMEVLAGEQWNPVLEHYSGYTGEELEYAVTLICKSLYQVEFTNTGKKLSAIKKKYAESKNFNISDDPKVAQNKDLIYERARKAKEFLAEKFKK